MIYKRYLLYIIETDGQPINKTFYAENNFLDDVTAIKNFRKLTRDDLLKKYATVKCVIDCNREKVFEFTEQRITQQQRTIDFLRRQ
jgi:hypothetical protein